MKKKFFYIMFAAAFFGILGCGQKTEKVSESEILEGRVLADKTSEKEDTELGNPEPETENDMTGPETENDTTGPITEEQYRAFKKTEEVQRQNVFDDFQETMHKNFLGTWYETETGEALRLTEEGAYVYIPYLDKYGDELYEWELIDRSEKGLCPELIIYYNGKENGGGLAYYIAGCADTYFWCNAQDYVFFRQ